MLLGVDVGGTFTDAVLVGDDGSTHTAKVPSTPREQQHGVLAAVHAVLERAGARPEQVRRFAHGMTVATNALLESTPERPPSRTALVATEGFTDIVELARQARPSLYDLCAAPPRPLAPAELRFGAPERMGPNGVLRELDARGTDAMIERLAAADAAGSGGGAAALLRPSRARAQAWRADRSASAARACVALARAGGDVQGV